MRALTLLDDDKLDREWIVRNILGGMATGFGLRGASSYVAVLPDDVILTNVVLRSPNWVMVSIGNGQLCWTVTLCLQR